MDWTTRVVRLEEALGHRFRDRDVLEAALTHGSYKNEQPGVSVDSQRLEFLGDAVIELVITAAVFERYPAASEGRLTELRARLVNTQALGSLAQALDLGSCLRLGRGEEQTGGRSRVSLLADGLEALLGAVYLDDGHTAAQRVIRTLFASRIEAVGSEPSKDPRSRLQEWSQATFGACPTYRVEPILGEAGEQLFHARVVLGGGKISAESSGASKKRAQRGAAIAALASIDRMDPSGS